MYRFTLKKMETAKRQRAVAKQPLLQKPLNLLVEKVGDEEHVRTEQKEKTQTALHTLYQMSVFSSSFVPCPPFYLADRTKARRRRHPAGVPPTPTSRQRCRLIQAGQLRALIRLGDFHSRLISGRGRNLVMQQRLTVSQVSSVASGRRLQWRLARW